MIIFKGAHVADSLDFLWGSFYPHIGDHEAKKFIQGHFKGTLNRIQLLLVLSKGGEGFPKIVNVSSGNYALGEHVVHVYLYVLSDLVLENFVY